MIALINHQGLKVVKGIQLQSPSPPIGLAYIGACLKQHGFEYTAVDACGLAIDQVESYQGSENVFIQGLSCQETVDRIPAHSKIVGFTCLFSHCWPLVRGLAEATRRRFPEAILVVGGEHVTAIPEQTLRESEMDLAVLGEGEETFLEIASSFNTGKDYRILDGVAYLDGGIYVENSRRKRVKNVDDFPFPDWDSWCIGNYIDAGQVTGVNLGRGIPILGSRGCPFNCKFCSNLGMWTTRYIMRDPVKLVDEIQEMKERYNLSSFSFMDLTFIINKKEIKNFARELIKRDLEITYQLPAGTRCEAFDDELAQLLEQSGLRNFAFAPEAADEGILKTIRKQIKLETFYQAVKMVTRTNMTVSCFFVIGFPEDTSQTIRKSLTMVRRLVFMGVHDVTVSKFTPYPGSDYFTELQRAGRITYDHDDLGQVIDFYSSEGRSYCDQLDSDQLYRKMIWMYLNFYVLSFVCRPWRVIRVFYEFFTKDHVENTRYMRFFSEHFFKRKTWTQRSKTNANV